MLFYMSKAAVGVYRRLLLAGMHLDLSPYPCLRALRKRVGARPAVKEVMRLESLSS